MTTLLPRESGRRWRLIRIKLPTEPLFRIGSSLLKVARMTLTINGIAISPERIETEAANHQHCAAPSHAAACALAIRELLLQRACEAGIAHPDDTDESTADAAIEELLDREAPVPEPTESECRRFYEQHADRFVVGELVEASHVLFAVTPDAPVAAIRRQAEATLTQVLAQPQRFAEFAQRFSNCPSGAQGGNLGQIQRGVTVFEFERVLFGEAEGVLPQLVNTRYGFHIVRIERRIAGKQLPFEAVQAQIARSLGESVRTKAAEQYVRILASKASISGIDLGAAASSLVQ
jgi:peptidyl-prolyl cis-trans isomerase C